MQDAHSLLSFLDSSPTPYHAVQSTQAILQKAGFRPLDEREAWTLAAGDRCYVVRNDSSILAMSIGQAPPEEAGFNIIGAHTDSPHLKVKPVAELRRHGYQQLAVEPYGGLLQSTWMDRDLSLAGRVLITSTSAKTARYLIDLRRPILRVPNLAIHLDREVNTKGLVLDKQKHMTPLLALDAEGGAIDVMSIVRHALQKEHGVALRADDVIEFDLSLYDVQKAALGGWDESFVFSARLDNLASCHAALSALTHAMSKSATRPESRVVVLWDHEECGSRSMQGAQGPFIRQVLERVVEGRSKQPMQALSRALARSFLISADMAHAIHPNYADKHEPNHAPVIGKGPVIKTNVNQSYASDAASSARFVSLCAQAGVKPQRFVVRSDLPCGSTIGPITSSLMGISTVDVGNPLLAMHSIRELAGAGDHAMMIDVLTRFFLGASEVRPSVAKRKRRS